MQEQLVVEECDTPTLVGLLREAALFLWKDWPRDMQAVTLDNSTSFSLTGICPHCKANSVFVQMTAVYMHPLVFGGHHYRLVVAMRCQGCLKYILGIVNHGANQTTYVYEEHYPIGTPDDDVASEIPKHIQPDFKEALRCLWVNAYNATAEMCRRALEASCVDLGAPKKDVLEDMIDWLADQRIITPFLQKVAHKIRLGGNRGAHPHLQEDSNKSQVADPPATSEVEDVSGPVIIIEKDHADAIVKFTREFFNHVYVVPKQLDKYDFSKPKGRSNEK